MLRDVCGSFNCFTTVLVFVACNEMTLKLRVYCPTLDFTWRNFGFKIGNKENLIFQNLYFVLIDKMQIHAKILHKSNNIKRM